MTCGYVDLTDDGETETCTAEATHEPHCEKWMGPVCANHACRKALTLAEAATRDERRRIPSHWMAL